MSQRPITLNYRSLLISRIKKKYLYLILGTLVIFSISFSLLLNFPPIKLSSKSMQKNSTSKAISPKTKSITYKVREGDQLWLISEKFFGSGLNVEDILRSNYVTNPDLIEVGQTLIIPSVKPKMPTVGELESGISTKKSTQEESYIVKEGDSLSSIALASYGDMYAWTRIAEANNLLNSSDLLEVGKVLTIPR